MIRRHTIKRNISEEYDFCKTMYLEKKTRLIERITHGKPFNLNGYKNTPIALARVTLLETNNEEDIYSILHSYLELGTYHFKRAQNKESKIEITIQGETYKIDSKENERSGVSLPDWWTLFCISQILRDNKLQDELYAHLEWVIAEDIDPFWNRSIDLIRICNNKKEEEPAIISDFEKIIESGVVQYNTLKGTTLRKSKEGSSIKDNMWLPIMKLNYLAFRKDEAGFNKLLEEYILWKKAWIIKNKEEDNSSYWIDFHLLACCAYAHDRNIKIEFESEYIPSFVYKGNPKTLITNRKLYFLYSATLPSRPFQRRPHLRHLFLR